jgi:hypothetical protein
MVLAEETRERDDKEELPRPMAVDAVDGRLRLGRRWLLLVAKREGGRERDGRLGLGMRRLLQVARREGERVLGLGEKRDLYNKTKTT